MDPATTSVRVYKYRWVILLIYCLYACINFMQFLQYSIIANITSKYYSVDGTLVDLTGLIFMIGFIVFCLPVNYLIERYNLNITAIISTGLTTVGNLIKLLSISPSRFYVVLIGQCLCAVGQVFMLSIPSKLASTWFGPEEVSTACAIAILGTQIGVAFGSIFPANFVKNSPDLDKIGDDFFTYNVVNASITCAIFVLVLIFFRASPALPPSQSQVNIITAEKMTMKEVAKAMVKNKNYLLLVAAFGSTNGMYTCFGIIINTVYLHYFPDSESQLGILTAAAVISGGCLGSLVFGYVLDKWHKFKLTSFFIMTMSAISYILVAVTMEKHLKIGTYFAIPIFGFFVASTLIVGFEFATEILYPVPEAAACSVLNSFVYLFTVVYTLILTELLDSLGYVGTHIVVIVILTISPMILYFINATLRRREANLQSNNLVNQ